MENQMEILSLLQDKQYFQDNLNNLIYGSIEIRKDKKNKYIYTHYRENGISLTKYIDIYSDDLYNNILINNIKAKELKKNIKSIDKKLKGFNYSNSNLDSKVELSIDFAKRNLVNSIYKQAVLEGIATTFADTESIIEGGKINNLSSEDINKVINLKRAWEFILNENVIKSKTNFNLLCEINKLIEQGFYYNAGKIRSVPVEIGGTFWKPVIPIESVIKEELEDFENSKIPIIDKAIEMLLFIMKRQIFIDGNKRTAVIFVNHFLISKGKGILIIPAELVEEFKILLISYYEGKDKIKIRKFLKEKCFIKI